MGAPAAAINPGFRWQRPKGAFHDPRVGEQYVQLCGQGELTLPWRGHQRTTRALSDALVRRAAEDGYRVKASHLDSGTPNWRLRIELVGPLTAEIADPEPSWRSHTAELYGKLRDGREVWVDWWYPSHALASRTKTEVIESELTALATRDGCELEWQKVGDHGDLVRLHQEH